MAMFQAASGKIQVALRIEWLGLLPERYNPDDKTRDVADICSALYIYIYIYIAYIAQKKT